MINWYSWGELFRGFALHYTYCLNIMGFSIGSSYLYTIQLVAYLMIAMFCIYINNINGNFVEVDYLDASTQCLRVQILIKYYCFNWIFYKTIKLNGSCLQCSIFYDFHKWYLSIIDLILWSQYNANTVTWNLYCWFRNLDIFFIF